jgi:Predicted SAM-dependent methyltransferases
MTINRAFAGPSSDTFDVPPIAGFVQKYLLKSKVSVDPFARNKRWATYTNDLNPDTAAQEHMDAESFLDHLSTEGIQADLVIFDPPYSPRQIAECYQQVGKEVKMEDTQNCVLYSRVRSKIPSVLSDNGVVLSFGWNSNGMGKQHGFEIIEILLVAHGAAHNDTICMAERRKPKELELWPQMLDRVASTTA